MSYARPDIAAARGHSGAPRTRGVPWWWDKEIPTGTTFDDELNRQLDAARSVVVRLWSRHLSSPRGQERGGRRASQEVAVSVAAGLVRSPFGYRRAQTADLLEWAPGDDHDAIERLVESLRDTLSQITQRPRAGHPETPGTSPRWIVAPYGAAWCFALLSPPSGGGNGIGAVAMAGMRLKTWRTPRPVVASS